LTLSASDIKGIRALQQKKFRKESGVFVVEGVKTVRELVNSDFSINAIYATEEFDFLEPIDSDLICFIKEKELERISGLRSANKILALAKIPDSKPIQWNNEVILLLDGINDPGNIGTIIRTAKWFGVDTILCSEDCADAFDRKVVQSTMGALFHVNIKYGNLSMVMDECITNGFTTVGAAMNGSSVYQYSSSPRTALVIGSESHGISKPLLEKCKQLITIPNNETSQKIESLNAGVATSIILSELTRPH
jgi:RNA methyltransferase, TrmH family